jgi:hypothetical protein
VQRKEREKAVERKVISKTMTGNKKEKRKNEKLLVVKNT